MTRQDALLASVVCLALAGVAVALDAPVTPVPVLVGVCGSLLLEFTLSLRAAAVRRLWSRPPVRIAAVGIAIATAAVTVAVGWLWVLTTLVSGLCTYLLLLGILAWRRSSTGS